MKDTSPLLPTDIFSDSLVEKILPVACHPYSRLARLDRPIGTWLLLLPCLFSVGLATNQLPDIRLLLLFMAGAIVMRGAGCTINDIIDRDFDKMVSRTSSRPIPSGSVSVKGAIVFLAIQLALGLIILLQFNTFTILLGVASIPVIALYPFAKRFTNWPQLFLGVTFNWGAILGWAAVHEEVGWPSIALYFGGIAWTLGYDTIYGHQDRKDDALIGLRSSSLKLGSKTKPWLFGFFISATFLFGLSGWLVNLSWPFYFCLILGLIHFCWQSITLDIDQPLNCYKRFKSNRDYGILLFLGIVLG